jgi:hypothetical protein
VAIRSVTVTSTYPLEDSNVALGSIGFWPAVDLKQESTIRLDRMG